MGSLPNMKEDISLMLLSKEQLPYNLLLMEISLYYSQSPDRILW